MTKNSIAMMALLAMMVTTLTACPGKSGGGSAATPPGNPAVQDCTNPDPNTGFCGATGNAGYIGIAEWTGVLDVSDQASYRAFLSENNLCNGWQCEQSDNKFKLAIETINTNLPGRAQFVLHSMRTNGGGRFMARLARAAFTADNNGLQLAYFPFGMNRSWNNNTPDQAPVSFRIVTQFTNSNRSEMNVQVYYRGVQIGNGHMVINGGFLQFDPNQFNGQPMPDSRYGSGQDYSYFFGTNFSQSWLYYERNHRPRRHHDHGNRGLQFSFGFSNGGLTAFGNYNGNL